MVVVSLVFLLTPTEVSKPLPLCSMGLWIILIPEAQQDDMALVMFSG